MSFEAFTSMGRSSSANREKLKRATSTNKDIDLLLGNVFSSRRI
jgi:hypothetical protein